MTTQHRHHRPPLRLVSPRSRRGFSERFACGFMLRAGLWLALLVVGGLRVLGTFACLADPAAPPSETEQELVPPRPRPDPAQLRERAGRTSPEERRKFLKELQERRGLAGTNRTEALARREELRDLPPQEKAARLREIRERLNQAGPKFHVLTPAERESKRTELQQRVQAQVDLLRKRQAESTLSEQETRRLERMEAMAKRLAAGEVLGPLQKTE